VKHDEVAWSRGRTRDDSHGGVLVDGRPLLFFHVHRLREIRPWRYAPRLADFGARATPLVRQRVCIPYLRTLRAVHRAAEGSSASLPWRRENVTVLDGGAAEPRSGGRQAIVRRSPGRVPVARAVPAGSSIRPRARQR
jgi:hypothetical protein